VFLEKMKILQLIPAMGWSAMISNAEFTDYTLMPLIAWALIKDRDDQDGIVGIYVGDARYEELGSAEDHDYFITYVAPGQAPIKGEELAAELEFTRCANMLRDGAVRTTE